MTAPKAKQAAAWVANPEYTDAIISLMAAAPDMYEALEDALAFMLGEIGGTAQRDGIVRESAAALAKARGETS